MSSELKQLAELIMMLDDSDVLSPPGLSYLKKLAEKALNQAEKPFRVIYNGSTEYFKTETKAHEAALKIITEMDTNNFAIQCLCANGDWIKIA